MCISLKIKHTGLELNRGTSLPGPVMIYFADVPTYSRAARHRSQFSNSTVLYWHLDAPIKNLVRVHLFIFPIDEFYADKGGFIQYSTEISVVAETTPTIRRRIDVWILYQQREGKCALWNNFDIDIQMLARYNGLCRIYRLDAVLLSWGKDVDRCCTIDM